MKRLGYFKDWKKVLTISFGLLTVLIYSFLLFHTFQFVPAEKEAFWWSVIVSYSLMLSLIIGVSDMRSKLFNIQTIKFIPRFLVFYIPSLVALSFILQWVNPEGTSLIMALLELPKWLLFLHGFVFATIESTIWQGFLDYQIGHPWSELTAGIFHWGIWTGGALFVIPASALLFAIFSLVNWYFRKNTDDLAPAIGLHTAWNHMKLLIGV
jgi:hypothetical protein